MTLTQTLKNSIALEDSNKELRIQRAINDDLCEIVKFYLEEMEIAFQDKKLRTSYSIEHWRKYVDHATWMMKYAGRDDNHMIEKVEAYIRYESIPCKDSELLLNMVRL
jgi:hypothetical protein